MLESGLEVLVPDWSGDKGAKGKRGGGELLVLLEVRSVGKVGVSRGGGLFGSSVVSEVGKLYVE